MVDMTYIDLGQIDAALQYKPPPETHVYETGLAYRLACGPGYMVTYDGKTKVQEKEVPGVKAWRIDGPFSPLWVTANAAIRYVLESRDRTKDSTIKKNADRTLARLMTFH
jgi:hypothetical protein